MTLVCALLVLLADQWSKRAVEVHANGPLPYGLASLVRLRLVRHRRRFFDSYRARNAMMLLWLTALASAMFLSGYTMWFDSPMARAGLGIAFGGSAGNLLDILGRKHVIDFIDLGWWPVFNLADVAIVTGLAIAFAF
jgi:signal peptidase II